MPDALVYTLAPMTEESREPRRSEDDRRRLIRMDSAKVNIAPPMSEAKWFRLVGVDIGNPTELYPNGDQVQTVEPWTPPDTFAGAQQPAAQPDPHRHRSRPAGRQPLSPTPRRLIERAAWRVIVKYCPDKTKPSPERSSRLWLNPGF